LCSLGVTQFSAAYGYASYEGRVRELIHLFKYSALRPLGKPLGRWLVRAFPRETRYDALVPVPLHWWKRFRRGFNQSEDLAREVSRHTGVPVLAGLKRRKRTQTQAGLSQSARRRNVVTAFAANPRVVLAGKRLLIIDDVFTSGATANACATALKKAGASRVDILTLARTDRRARFATPDFAVTNPVRGAFE
jgi:ComF family protein